MSRPMIVCNGVSKKYSLGERQPYYSFRDTITKAVSSLAGKKSASKNSEFWALNNVSFEVEEGDVVGVIGRNGAGKSTLLKILSRITPPTKGQVNLNGRVASLLEVGTGFHPELTGRENVYLNGAILGMRRAEINEKFDDIVEFAEIEKFLDTPVKRYSSGMYMRLAFAVAAHLEPEILLIDEVLAVGDAAFQKKCLGKMDEISKKTGRTILFVSHNMAAIRNLCKRTICLDKGEVLFDGETDSAIDCYGKLSDTFINKAKLANRTDRSGSQLVTMTDFWIENRNGDKVSSVKSGDKLALVFAYRCKKSPVRKVDWGISFHRSDLSSLSIVYSSYMNKLLTLDKETGTVRFEIEKMPFNQGVYKIAARVTVGGEEADWIQNEIAEVEVEAGDYYGVGNIVPDNNFPFLVDGTWHV